MPRRNIRGGIVSNVKPHQLIAALMLERDLGTLPLAKAIGRASLQAPIYRFVHGEVASPKRSTAEALATYFRLPVDALYDERLATAIANERGLRTPPQHVPQQRRERRKAQSSAGSLRLPVADDAATPAAQAPRTPQGRHAAHLIDALKDAAQRDRMLAILSFHIDQERREVGARARSQQRAPAPSPAPAPRPGKARG